MSRKLILVLFVMVCLFCQLGFNAFANPNEQSLVAFSSGALLVETAPEYNFEWGNFMIMDENPQTGWCCPEGKISDNTFVFELAEKSVIDSLQFDTYHIDKEGRGAKDILVELSDVGPKRDLLKSPVFRLLIRKTIRNFR